MEVRDESYAEQMGACVNDSRFADVVFRFSDSVEAIHAHKVILAARSPVMQQALSINGDWYQQHEIRLDEGVEPAAFLHLLRYMYTSAASVPPEHLHSGLLLAHRFQVVGMVSAVEGHLGNSLAADNLLMNLEVAEICGLSRLRSRCAERLQQPGVLPRLLDGDALRRVALPGLRALLALEPLPVDEVQLFLAALRWAATQVGEDLGLAPQPVSREVAELVAPLMELIRFPTMSGKELRKVVKPYNVVDPARYVEALEFLADVDSDAEDLRDPRHTAPRFRPRHPAPASQHMTPRRRIERLAGEVSRLATGSPGAVPVSTDQTPPRGYRHLPSPATQGWPTHPTHSAASPPGDRSYASAYNPPR
eukprot:Hpha_TRINITY_DN29613_c0_g1::TRINITY_DN29613_c0_g1_i1::g.165279::m.165279/K10477/BTBD1_2; BTB/POZ domain-containing protein 1/2